MTEANRSSYSDVIAKSRKERKEEFRVAMAMSAAKKKTAKNKPISKEERKAMLKGRMLAHCRMVLIFESIVHGPGGIYYEIIYEVSLI